MPVDVIIAVVTYNSAEHIQGLLDSIPEGLGAHTACVVVVDNGSTDETLNILGRRTDCLVIVGANVGYAAGINKAVAAVADQAPILMLNPDARILPHAVANLLGTLARHGVGVVAPRICSEDGTLQFSLRREPTLIRNLGLGRTRRAVFSEYVNAPSAYERACVVDWALGAVLLISRECWRQIGPLDESYFLYSEETDFCLRARDLGWATFYEPSAHAIHSGGGSGRSGDTHAMQVINRLRLYSRRHSRPSSLAYWVLSVVGELSWLARGNSGSARALVALIMPSRRPVQLNCSLGLIPN